MLLLIFFFGNYVNMEVSMLVKIVRYNRKHLVIQCESMFEVLVTCYLYEWSNAIESARYVRVDGFIMADPDYRCHDFLDIPDEGVYVDAVQVEYLETIDQDLNPWYISS
jgi:hypothetical protein